MSFQSVREELIERLGIEPEVEYTIVFEHGPYGKQRRLNRMFLERVDNYGIVFRQITVSATHGAREREHVFDGTEIVQAIETHAINARSN